MRYRELFEGRDAPLYHGCGVTNAVSIIHDDAILARTYHNASAMAGLGRQRNCDAMINVAGVSLTRNKAFATTWGGVVFTIDQKKLSHTSKLSPFDHWSAQDPKELSLRQGHRDADGYEFEEFCHGPVKPLSRYLLAIDITGKSFRKSIEQCQYWSSEMKALYPKLFNHPLMRVAHLSKPEVTKIISNLVASPMPRF